jgi:hypothetical protein
VLDLYLFDHPFPFHDVDRVQVTGITSTSFTFTALAGHVDMGTITFSIRVDSKGNLILIQHAQGPDLLSNWLVDELRLAKAKEFWGTMARKLWDQLYQRAAA